MLEMEAGIAERKLLTATRDFFKRPDSGQQASGYGQHAPRNPLTDLTWGRPSPTMLTIALEQRPTVDIKRGEQGYQGSTQSSSER